MCLSPKNQKCSFISRIALLFSISALLFPRSVFLFNVFLFNGFFPRRLYFLLALLRAAQRDNNCLALKTSTWIVISFAFYSSFILHGSLENAISENLEWLKLNSWKHLELFWMYLTLPFFLQIAPNVFKCIFTIIDFLHTVFFKNNFHA